MKRALSLVFAVVLVHSAPIHAKEAARAGRFGTRKSLLLAGLDSYKPFVWQDYNIQIVGMAVNQAGDLGLKLRAEKRGRLIFGPDHLFIYHNPPVCRVHGVLDPAGALTEMVGDSVRLADLQGAGEDDPTLTVFPDAGNPGVTSCDGDVGTNSDSSWSSALVNAACIDCSTTNVITTESSVGNPFGTTLYSVIRALVNFDTSSLTSSAVISSATVSVKTQTTVIDYQTAASVRLVTNSIFSNTAYSLSDFNSFGTTAQAPDLAIESMSPNSYQTWTLNATGLANISKTGVTHFGMRTTTDINGVAPVLGTDPAHPDAGGAVVFWNSADNTGTTSDPKLTINYTNPPRNGDFFFTSGGEMR